MSNEQLADLTQPQRDRLAFVELRVRFIGEIVRRGITHGHRQNEKRSHVTL